MIEPKLVELLRCPRSGQTLEIAEESLVQRLNAAIESGRLRDHCEQRVKLPIDGGLVTADQQRMYPIRDQIPTMIADESIPLDQLAETS